MAVVDVHAVEDVHERSADDVCCELADDLNDVGCVEQADGDGDGEAVAFVVAFVMAFVMAFDFDDVYVHEWEFRASSPMEALRLKLADHANLYGLQPDDESKTRNLVRSWRASVVSVVMCLWSERVREVWQMAERHR